MAELIEQTRDKLVLRKMIAAPRKEVFDAWLDAEGMKHWMCPGNTLTAEAQIDARVGGAFRIVMKGANQDADHTGVYRLIEPPSKLTFTWISKATDRAETLVTVELFDRDGQTELILAHERLPTPEATEKHKGWLQIVDKLAAYAEQRTRDFRMVLSFNAPASKLYEQFATGQGVRNWWTRFCEMEEKGRREGFIPVSQGRFLRHRESSQARAGALRGMGMYRFQAPRKLRVHRPARLDRHPAAIRDRRHRRRQIAAHLHSRRSVAARMLRGML